MRGQAGRCTGSLHRDDELADRAAAFELGDRFVRLVEGVGFADQRGDLAILPQLLQLGDVGGVLLRLARGEGAPEHAANIAAFQQGEVERHLGDARRETDY